VAIVEHRLRAQTPDLSGFSMKSKKKKNFLTWMKYIKQLQISQ